MYFYKKIRKYYPNIITSFGNSGLFRRSFVQTNLVGKSVHHCITANSKTIIPKKVELLIRFFEPFWISRVFHFFLRTFGEVEAHPGPLVASDETYPQSKFDIFGSNETTRNALASIV